MRYKKQQPIISFEDFLKAAKEVNGFTSATGRRFYVESFEGNTMNFIPMDAEWEILFPLDLDAVYHAYATLENFRTKPLRSFVPVFHSPARGLLLRLGLITV